MITNSVSPSSDMIEVTVDEGKYTVRQLSNGEWECLRHGEHWPAMASGPDNLHVALATEVAELRAKLGRLCEDPCMQKLRTDEPFFVLLGRDFDGARALAHWINCRFTSEGRTPKLSAASDTHKAFLEYHAKCSAEKMSKNQSYGRFAGAI